MNWNCDHYLRDMSCQYFMTPWTILLQIFLNKYIIIIYKIDLSNIFETYNCEMWVVQKYIKKKNIRNIWDVVMDAFGKDKDCAQRKTNDQALEHFGEKRAFVDSIKFRHWKMVGHALRHPKELHSMIIDDFIKGTKTVE